MHPHRTLVAIGALWSLAVFGVVTPVGAQPATPDAAQVAFQSAAVTPNGQMSFAAAGFEANESAAVTIVDDQGNVQAHLDPIALDTDGTIDMAAISVPSGLALGPHTLLITGQTSGRVARASFQVQWQPPIVHLDVYTGKPTHSFGFSGSGFVPGEQVDVFLGPQTTAALATLAADPRGTISGRDLTIPLAQPGDYTLAFVGRNSHTPVSVGFNVQGFSPWAVLDNYYVAPRMGIGFTGDDFVPGEVVMVYLNTRLSQPVAQTTADEDGHFAAKNALELPDLTGNNQLIFVGQQSQTEVTTTFAAVTLPPSTSD
jgi:hypothetical protein